MGTKNISLKKSAYERLSSLKKENESFSDLVERLTKNEAPRYSELAGLLSEKTIKAIESTSVRRREKDEAEFEEMLEKFGRGEK